MKPRPFGRNTGVAVAEPGGAGKIRLDLEGTVGHLNILGGNGHFGIDHTVAHGDLTAGNKEGSGDFQIVKFDIFSGHFSAPDKGPFAGAPGADGNVVSVEVEGRISFRRQQNGTAGKDLGGFADDHAFQGTEVMIFGVGIVLGPLLFFVFPGGGNIFAVIAVEVGKDIVAAVEHIDVFFTIVVFGITAAVGSFDIDAVFPEGTAVEDLALVHDAVEPDPDGALTAAGIDLVHGKAVADLVPGAAPSDDIAAGAGGLGAVGKGSTSVDGRVFTAGKADAVGVEKGGTIQDHAFFGFL